MAAIAPYRPLLVLMLVSSAASFAALGALSLFARDQLGASDRQVTASFVTVALTGLAAMLLTGRISDRPGAGRVVLPAALAWLAAGYAVLSFVRSYPALLAASAGFFCVVGVPTAQLMAHARRVVDRQADATTSTAAIAMMRIALSVGSFAGFGCGGLGLAYLGARPLFRLVAATCLGCAVLAWILLHADRQPALPPGPVRGGRVNDPAGSPGTPGTARLLLLFTLVMVLFASGRVMQLAQLPILVRESLDTPVQTVGFALALPPLCELVLMPAAAWAALRWGRGRVFLTGGAASAIYYGGLVTVRHTALLMLLQVVYAVFGAATIMVGIDLAQRLTTGQVGTATSIYLSHENVATVFGSLVAATAVTTLGTRLEFLVPATLCLLGLTLATILFTRHPDAFDLPGGSFRAGRRDPTPAIGASRE